MKHKLKRWWYIFIGDAKFRTVYTDGRRTHKMSYQICSDYAEIFGGIVIEAFD